MDLEIPTDGKTKQSWLLDLTKHLLFLWGLMIVKGQENLKVCVHILYTPTYLPTYKQTNKQTNKVCTT